MYNRYRCLSPSFYSTFRHRKTAPSISISDSTVLVIPILCTPGFHTTANATRAASPACQKSCCLSCCWGSALTGSLLSFLHPHLSGWKVKDGKCRLSRQSTALGASKPETSRTLCHRTAESRTTILILTYKRKRQPAWFRF